MCQRQAAGQFSFPLSLARDNCVEREAEENREGKENATPPAPPTHPSASLLTPTGTFAAAILQVTRPGRGLAAHCFPSLAHSRTERGKAILRTGAHKQQLGFQLFCCSLAAIFLPGSFLQRWLSACLFAGWEKPKMAPHDAQASRLPTAQPHGSMQEQSANYWPTSAL